MYHIMIRSISEIDLFKDDDDKMKYLSLIKKYQYKYGFGVYAYCLMDNHGHLIIDCLGADISKIMQVVNFCYAQYYNRKYRRHGPVFQDRFKSTIIDSDRYFITLSAYIHNNPKDIKEYSENVAAYPFSSMKEYINGTNTFRILNARILKDLVGFNNAKNKDKYLDLVNKSDCKEIKNDIEFVNTKTEYRSGRNIILRDTEPKKIITYVANYLKQDHLSIHIKYNKSYTKLRALSCFLISCFCDIKQREICDIIGNITQSRVSKLSIMGLELALKENKLLEECLMV